MAGRPPTILRTFDGAQARKLALSMLSGVDCVVALKALGEETRVQIIELLLQAPLGVGEISRRLAISPYNASKHLRILREAGLLDVEKDGRRRLYALPEVLKRRETNEPVLDLGCCTFKFQQAGKLNPRAARTGKTRPRDSSTTSASRAR